ncbi:MAG: ABC transporter substrate-binding protein [Alphaproteobacteria bacterium]|nr:ABC transporter substrate-binding protein [Alphaproteobacteria bacterium]
MKHFKAGIAFGGAFVLAAGALAYPAMAQKKGGTLTYVVGSKIPSYDGHAESTFGVIHPIRPFYSLLIRVNPENPGDPSDFVCDVCEGDVPQATDDGKTYTFKIRSDIKFHDGTPLTAQDVVASFQKIVNPPQGIRSIRKAYFRMVESIEAPDDKTVVFKLSFPTGSFIPSVAMPFNFIYSKKDLDQHGYEWHQRNVNGTGAFKFVEHQPGAFVTGVRYDGYHHQGKPYLDGFRSLVAPKLATRVLAIESDRAQIEFRGFPPKSRDDLKKVLGDKITVQEGDWNCGVFLTPNHTRKPFDDPRVRRALNLALDRWGGSKYLSRIAIVKTVGGIVFPGHKLAATQEDLEKLEGYWPDINKSRELAKKLLKEAGHENLEFTLTNRGVDQPYKLVGTWAIDQWRKIGVSVKQDVVTTPVWYDRLRKSKEFDVSTDANCQSVVNPIADVSKWLGSAGSNYAAYKDEPLEEIYNKLLRSGDESEQRTLMRQMETHVISDQAHMMTSLWWRRISAYQSYVKGWKTSPSHYLNQHLDNIWLDK